MTTAEHRFYTDWDADGFWCRDADSDDALNLIPTALTWANINNSAAAGGSVTKVNLITRYGIKVMRVITDATANDGGYFGRDSGAVVDDIPVTAQAYTASFWVRGVTNYENVLLEAQIRDQANNALATFGANTLTNQWARYDTTFTPGGAVTHIFFDTHKFGSTNLVNYQVAGVMLVAGSTAPTGFNVGHATNGYDNISDDVKAARWHLGMRQAYQLMSDENRLELSLNNKSRRYSPEYASSPLYGYLLPLRKLQVETDDVVMDGDELVLDGTELVMDGETPLYLGYIDHYRPEMGFYSGNWECRIEAVNAKRFMEDKLDLPLQLGVTADEVLTTIFTDHVQLPATIDTAALYDFEAGSKTHDYVGDNWDSITTAWQAAQSLTQAERGKFFFARDGRATFFNREHFELDVDPVTAIDDTMAAMGYSYATKIINECHVKVYPRKTNASQRLWELDSPLTLAGGEAQEITARFAAADGQQVGGDDVETPNTGDGSLVFSSGTATLSGFVANAQSATFTLTNDSATTECVVSGIHVDGTKLTSWNSLEATRRGNASIAAYGRRILTIDARLLDLASEGRDRAAYEVAQRKDPRGMVENVTLKLRNDEMLGEILVRPIGTRITVAETQTATDGEYYIVGESHDWRAGGKDPTTTWYLEPANIFNSWLIGVVGRSEIGVTTIVGL